MDEAKEQNVLLCILKIMCIDMGGILGLLGSQAQCLANPSS